VALHLTVASADGADDAWQPSDFTLVEALDAGFAIVDTYHSNEGHLFFVLQLQNNLLLCKFEEVQAQKCLQLGDS
jgi:hypothetical protein